MKISLLVGLTKKTHSISSAIKIFLECLTTNCILSKLIGILLPITCFFFNLCIKYVSFHSGMAEDNSKCLTLYNYESLMKLMKLLQTCTLQKCTCLQRLTV